MIADGKSAGTGSRPGSACASGSSAPSDAGTSALECVRCPYTDCGFVHEASPRAREVTCARCGRTARPRLLRHENILASRASDAAHRLPPPTGDFFVLAEDVRSLWNIGSLFRSADGLGVDHLFLCGISGIPPHPTISRTALGADEVVSWSYVPHAFAVLDAMRARGIRTVVLETGEGARRLRDARRAGPLLLVVGNEVQGVSVEVISRADERVCDCDARAEGEPERGGCCRNRDVALRAG